MTVISGKISIKIGPLDFLYMPGQTQPGTQPGLPPQDLTTGCKQPSSDKKDSKEKLPFLVMSGRLWFECVLLSLASESQSLVSSLHFSNSTTQLENNGTIYLSLTGDSSGGGGGVVS